MMFSLTGAEPFPLPMHEKRWRLLVYSLPPRCNCNKMFLINTAQLGRIGTVGRADDAMASLKIRRA